MLVHCSVYVCAFVLGAFVCPRPLEHSQVPDRGGYCALLLVLGAPIGAPPMEDLEVHVFGSSCTRQIVLGVPYRPRPLEDFKVPVVFNVFAEALNVGLESSQPRVL